MKGMPFLKMHGLGNDFVVLDARAHSIEATPPRIRAIADRLGKSNDAVKVSLRRSRAALAEGVPELDSVLDGLAHSA